MPHPSGVMRKKNLAIKKKNNPFFKLLFYTIDNQGGKTKRKPQRKHKKQKETKLPWSKTKWLIWRWSMPRIKPGKR